MADVRDVNRKYGQAIAERLRELHADGKTIGICGLAGGTRTPEGTIAHGTFEAIVNAVPSSKIVNATDLLQEVRCVKSQEEIDALQDSVDLVEKAYEAEIEWAAKPGVHDYEVWAAAMYAMFSRGSELSVHFNWITDNPPTRTLTRPQHKVLQDGDIIENELEASVIGYRAQQTRPVAVRSCDPIYVDLMEFHRDVYDQVLDFMRPGVSLPEVIARTQEIGQQLCPKSGPLAGGAANFVCHGRGLGDDFPLATNQEAVARFRGWSFPENGVFIVKPQVRGGNGTSIGWATPVGSPPRAPYVWEKHGTKWS